MPRTSLRYPYRILLLGATSGIATATARIFAGRGARFFLVARNRDKLTSVAQDLMVRGASAAETWVTDLDDVSLHEAMLAAAAERLGEIDLALIAHGLLGDQTMAEENFAAAGAVLHTNLISPISLATWLANYFRSRGQGTLAVISSVAGDRGRKSNYVYGASKAGLNAFLDGLRNRVDREGVHVLTIKPGLVATSMTWRLPPSPLFASPERVARGIVRAVERRRDVVYLPWFWAPILFAVRAIPGRIFKKMNL